MQSGEDRAWLCGNLRQPMQAADASTWEMVQKDESWEQTPGAL